MADGNPTIDPITVATGIAAAYLANPHSRASANDVKALLAALNAAVRSFTSASPTTSIADSSDQPTATFEGAVTARKSLAKPDHIISMIDGKPYRTLKRHLGKHGLTPDQYRERYNLKPDYPMVAPAYAKARSEEAKARGFGRKPGESPRKHALNRRETAPTEAPSKKSRVSVSEARKRAAAHLAGN